MNIWLMNHYASNMYRDRAGRHYWFAQRLMQCGHTVAVFCAATYLNGDYAVELKGRCMEVREQDGIPFVFVKTVASQGNGLKRVENMGLFYKNLFPTAKRYAAEHGKPDVIVASSVHPLTMIAGIQIAKRMKIPCVCEIRDLWPEAIFSFGKASADSLLGWILVAGEHWIYRRADALIFTKEGDTDYLKEKRWTRAQGGDIDLEKCHYINNGVDLAAYYRNIETEQLGDEDLLDSGRFNVTYAGTIRPVNNVGNLIDAAAIMKAKPGYRDVQFLIFGDGIQLPELKDRVKKERLDNVKLKGFIQRKYIPFILSRSSVNILNYSQSHYNWTRGNSSNKLFEYMASGKPIISTVRMGYSILEKYRCGVELDEDTPQALAEQIMRFHDMSPEERADIGKNAKEGAKDFDFSVLTDKLIRVLESVTACRDCI